MILDPVVSNRRYAKACATTAMVVAAVVLSACSNVNKKPPESIAMSVAPDGTQSTLPLNAVPVQNPQFRILAGNEVQNTGNAGQNFAALPSSTPTANVISNQTKFSSKAYGVAGSPRVTTSTNVRKGGGRYHVGKPYTIRGVRYVPQENPNYRATGLASWYGPNFHGRLTANGEIYDQFALSAAHPTMPLPSYAKVTNLENGASVLVRVNDRGPFSKKRIIDLSSRAAQLLGYSKKGVAKVKVEYAGKARMDGLDEPYLVASYNPGSLDPNSIPANPGRTVLASNQPQQKPASKVRIKRKRKPLFSFDNARLGDPVLVNGFQSEDDGNNASRAIDSLMNPAIVAPETGMSDLSIIKFGPVASKKEAFELVEIVSAYGPVSVFEEASGFALQATIARESVETLRAALNH